MKPNKKSLLLLILVFWIAMTVATAQETPRVALVIGNGDYQELGMLRNPPNDARDMATTLQGLGFTVELLIDADVVEMEEAVILFGQRLRASRDTTGFFFYAGHGVQHQGENYLIPTGASIGSEVFLRSRSVSAQAVLDTMQSAGNNLNVVVLDACRDNPFGWSRSGQRGLSQVSSQPPGSIIAYATSSGDVSGDGDGRNGVFTTELLRTLTVPGLDVSEIFRLNGQAVRNITNGKQIPAVYSQFFDTAVLLPGDTPAGNLLPSTPFSTTPSVTVSTEEKQAELFITSDPTGAVVTIDGIGKGNTPLFLDNILVGSILVIEARLGTKSVREEYRVNETNLQEIVLKLKQDTGNLLILTTEQQAELFLDGESQGEVGTGLLRDIPTGEYRVELKVPGRKAEQRVTVTVGETARITPVFLGETYQVRFDANGGTPSGQAQKDVTYEQPYGALPEATRDGYSFAGWWTGRNGTGREIAGATVVSVTADQRLYAKWDANTYTVSFDRQGGSGGTTSVKVTYAAGMPRIANPTKTGWYLFDGYYTGTNGTGTKYYTASMASARSWDLTANTTLYAKWERISFTLPMTYVEGGTFQMGSNDGESDERPVHTVSVDSFSIGTYEVTQDIYEAVMGSNPSYFKGAELPVEQVSWYDAVEFCNALSRRDELEEVYTISGTDVSCDWSKRGYRLPTEAEWEYAVRGGNKSQGYTYAGSDTAGDVAWYGDNSGSKTHPVGQKQANELGLYDMSGNVWEWCWDRSGSYSTSAATNPSGPSSGSYRVVRGGGWYYDATNVRTAYRDSYTPSRGSNLIGFRVLVPAE